ncbi:MAG: NAD(P)-dependent oxidoreductase [Gemmataceae bacterium]|nr:NAD(P)-dependent oxidoreductase [Gemmataceae bacterium]
MSQSGCAVVAGINGFIGAAVARRLRELGWRVLGVLRAGRSWDRLAEVSGLELIEVTSYAVDVLRSRLAGIRADVVVNLAAAGVAAPTTDWRTLFEGNAFVATNLLTVAPSWGIRRFIHVGSYSEYAPGQAGVLMDEAWPQQPSSAYGVAKLAATLAARVEAARRSVPLTVLRLFGVYGPGEAPHRLLPRVLRGLTDGSGVDLTPGWQQRDWLYVDDAAEAIITAASATDLGPSGTIYNICTGIAASVREVVDWACQAWGGESRLLRWGAVPPRPDEPQWAVGDGRRFHEATGWQPRWHWRDGVRTTIARRSALAAVAA